MHEDWRLLPSLAEISARIQRRDISPVEVVKAVLRRIDEQNSTINAYIATLSDAALRAAEEAEREIAAGDYHGPLHGVPLSVKDLIWTRSYPTTAGSRIMAGFVPAEDAIVVERLRAAGGIIIGKANLMEFAYGASHPDYGPTKNPWDLTKSTYGSSGGSAAAVALGMDFGSFGSDTAGSIRIPAAFCGVTGMKPTSGRIPRHGVQLGSWTLDQLGPIARSVEDVATLLTATAGPDSRDPQSLHGEVFSFMKEPSMNLVGHSIALVTTFMGTDVDPEVLGAIRSTLDVFADAGAAISEISLPQLEGVVISALTKIVGPEAAYNHRAWLGKRDADYTATVLDRLRAGTQITTAEYFDGLERRARLTASITEAQRDIDLLVMPTTPMVAVDLEDEVDSADRGRFTAGDFIRFTAPFNLTGQPALTLPCGFTRGGLPIGLQIVGRQKEDHTVLRAGHVYQTRTSWHTQPPPSVASRPLL